MTRICCPYCGAASTEAARSDGSFVCQSCGKAVEPPPTRQPVVPPPIANAPQGGGGDSHRWSAGPPEESAKRWSTIAPCDDDESISSVSVSQSSILPREGPETPAEFPPSDSGDAARPARSPLVWLLVILVLFVLMLIGGIMLARSIRPWLDARRVAAERTKVEFWWPKLDSGARNRAAKRRVR